MKKLVFCLLALFATTIMLAETQYKIVEITGNIYKFDGKQKSQLKKGDKVTDATVVMVTYKSSMKIESTVSRENFEIKKVGKNNVKALIGTENNVLASGKDYVDYVSKQINGNANIHKVQSDPATVTRETDSVKVDTIINVQ